MKKNYFVFLIAVICWYKVNAQRLNPDKIPSAVTANYHSKYPGATQEIWAIKGNNVFEAEFFYEGIRMSAEFDKTGQWRKTEYAIKLAQLSGPVADAINKKIESYKLIGAMQRITVTKGTNYIVGLSRGSKKYEFYFSDQGKLLKKESLSEGDD